MTTIAWAIVVASILGYDVALIYKFGNGYNGAGFTFFIFSVAVINLIIVSFK